MNVTHCHQCTTVTTDKTLVNTITPFNNSPLSKYNTKSILKSPIKPIIGTTKKVRFQLPPRHHNRSGASHSTPICKAALDSAATTNCFPANYWGTNHQPHTKASQAILAQTANDTIMASIATDQLNAPKLPAIARDTHLFKEINIPLLSVNKLCAGDLAVLFHGPNATVFKPTQSTISIDGEPILFGTLDKSTELYMVDIAGNDPNPSKLPGGNITKRTYQQSFHKANSVTVKTIPKLINFYHMTMGAPPITTWLNAINKGWFTSFPGLASSRFRQYCTNKIETSKGHMKLQRQHTASTKPKANLRNNTYLIRT